MLGKWKKIKTDTGNIGNGMWLFCHSAKQGKEKSLWLKTSSCLQCYSENRHCHYKGRVKVKMAKPEPLRKKGLVIVITEQIRTEQDSEKWWWTIWPPPQVHTGYYSSLYIIAYNSTYLRDNELNLYPLSVKAPQKFLYKEVQSGLFFWFIFFCFVFPPLWGTTFESFSHFP